MMKPSWRSFLQTRQSKAKRAARLKLGLRVESLEDRQLLATGITSYSFDLGTIARSRATNIAPTANAGGPYSGTVGQALTFKGSATDPNPADTAAGFTYTWNFGDYSAQVSGKGLSSPSHVYNKAGTYRVFVSATDRNGATGTVAMGTVTISSASTPNPLTASAGGTYTAKEGASTALSATATGGTGAYAFAWDLDNNGTYETAGQNVSSTFKDNGAYTVGLRVTDAAGKTAVSTATVNVTNVAPIAQAGGPYSGTAGQSLTLKGSATDPSSADTTAGFTYSWDFGDGSAIVSGLGLTSPSHVFANAGTYTVIVTATDKDSGTSARSSAVITIAPPTAPTLTASAGGTYTGNEGSAVALKATANGGTGAYTFAWDLDNNGTYETAGQNVSSTFKDNGAYTVGLRVTDAAGKTAVSTATVNVTNVAPIAQAGGPYSGTAGQSLTLKGSATDPSSADTTAGFTYSWDFGDGSAIVSGLGLTSPSHVFANAGTYTVIVTATDKDSGTSARSSAVITIAPPTAPTLTASAGGTYTGKEGSAVALKATASGGTGAYSYAWDLDNNGTYETAGQNVSSTFKDNGAYTVGLRVTDAAGKTAVSTATVTVTNVAPTALAGGPYTITAGQSLTFKGSATDPSSTDTAAGLTYTWVFGDGTTNASGKDLSAPSHVYTKAGTYTATLTVTDKDGAVSASTTAVVTVNPTGGGSTNPPTGSALFDNALVKWQSQMITYGRQAANELRTATGDPALAATYYDSARVFYEIADYTGDSSWLNAVNDSLRIYRDNYVIKNNGNVPANWIFTEGLKQNYLRTGNTASRDAVLSLAKNAAYASDSTPLSWTASSDYSREVAYNILAQLDAESLGAPHRARTDALATQALGHLYEETVSQTASFVRPFMVALSCEALIAYQEKTGDTRVLPAIKTALDWIWTNCWNASARAFAYTNIESPNGTGGTEPAPDLNLLIAPAYAWVYHQTGDTKFRDRGDAAFAGGVDQAWLVGAKQFDQSYRWSFDYVTWRTAAPLNS